MGWFSKDKPPLRRPHMERVQDHLPQAKPFTKALMLRASQHVDEAYDDLKKMIGKVNSDDTEQTFEEFVTSCASCVAQEITSKAAKSINVSNAFYPGFELPKEARYVSGFSLYVLFLISEYLTGDDVKIDIWKTVIEAARTDYQFFYRLDQIEEGAKLAKDAVTVFEEVQAGKGQSITAWKDGLSKAISMYVLQWTSDNAEFKKFDCVPFFGKSLKILINVGLHGLPTTEDIG